MRFLIIDDVEDCRRALAASLQRLGHNTRACASARDGIQELIHGTFDALFTDILMPDKDGFEVIREVRRKWPGLHIIAISGGARLPPGYLLKTAHQLGATCILQKPFKREELVAVLPAPSE